MKVNQCMCHEVYSCTPDTTIADCAKEMCQNHVGCIPVCNQNNEILGLVTDRDLILRCVACDKDPKTTKINDIMTSDVCCCTPSDDIENVENKMNTLNIKRIPVVENKQVVGMITLSDLIKNSEIDKKRVYLTIENICNDNTDNAQ